jgi:hypothetical protein
MSTEEEEAVFSELLSILVSPMVGFSIIVPQ